MKIKFLEKWLALEEEKRRISSFESKLFRKYNDMLCCRLRCKILDGKTSSDVETQYYNFYSSFRSSDNGMLGGLWSIDHQTVQVNGGKVFMIVEYTIFELKDGVKKSDYESAVFEYNKFCSLINRLTAVARTGKINTAYFAK